MNLNKQPLVSIGMPVYNEARFLRQTLDSLVQQDYPAIELIISDNASDDETEKICHEYCKKYPYIQYHRFDKNLGPAINFSHVFQTATGKYFMWVAGHDLWANNYLTACTELLESHPDAVIAYGSTQWINEYNEPFGREYGCTDTRGMDIIARYFTILWGNMHPFYGLIRKNKLTYPILNTVGIDLIILSHLILKGDFVHSVKTSWSRREFRFENNHKEKLKRYKESGYGLIKSLPEKIFPLARLPFELTKAVLLSNSSWPVKSVILFLLLFTFPVRYFSGKRSNTK